LGTVGQSQCCDSGKNVRLEPLASSRSDVNPIRRPNGDPVDDPLEVSMRIELLVQIDEGHNAFVPLRHLGQNLIELIHPHGLVFWIWRAAWRFLRRIDVRHREEHNLGTLGRKDVYSLVDLVVKVAIPSGFSDVHDLSMVDTIDDVPSTNK
jgi:hypothetical protein